MANEGWTEVYASSIGPRLGGPIARRIAGLQDEVTDKMHSESAAGNRSRSWALGALAAALGSAALLALRLGV